MCVSLYICLYMCLHIFFEGFIKQVIIQVSFLKTKFLKRSDQQLQNKTP